MFFVNKTSSFSYILDRMEKKKARSARPKKEIYATTA